MDGGEVREIGEMEIATAMDKMYFEIFIIIKSGDVRRIAKI